MNNTNEQPEVIGQIKEGFFLRIYIGDGETDTGIKFELAQSTGNGAPIVLVGKKAFLLSWDDIVSLAEKAGLFGEEKQREQETIKFSSPQHRFFYKEQLARVRTNDCYHRALIYALGITEDTRKHFNEIFDIKKDVVLLDSITEGWVTGTTVRLLRLAFNLYTDDTGEEEPEDYTVSRIFGRDSITEYMLQAVALRFE